MSSIRILILGVLLDKPRHGYDVRRELELWNVEHWANVAYGSIYSALNKMKEEGLVEVVNTDQKGKQAARTEYAITESGKIEFERLLRDYWWVWKPSIEPFQVALTFMNKMPHDELLAALHSRAEGLQSTIRAFEFMSRGKTSHPKTPRHIAENLRLAKAQMETELHWIEETIGKVERGELP